MLPENLLPIVSTKGPLLSVEISGLLVMSDRIAIQTIYSSTGQAKPEDIMVIVENLQEFSLHHQKPVIHTVWQSTPEIDGLFADCGYDRGENEGMTFYERIYLPKGTPRIETINRG